MAVDVWAAILVVVGRGVRKWLGFFYFLVVLLAFMVAFLMTSSYSYYANPNTHIFGWPIPRVIFQRDTPTSPWLDYVGTISALSYPMNFVLYMFFPSVVAVILILLLRRRDQKLTSN
ncbi:MAG: hypothetical protein ACLQSR_01265 [Limisphaerales bacterium]